MLTTPHDVDLPMEAYPETRCIHDLFAIQAARTPDRVALVDAHTSWTYARLHESTNRMARRLQSAGVGPEVTVACYLSSPAAVVVHILATLKAGGRYLLLDHHLPPARLQHMITDAGPALIIHDAPLPPLLEQGAALILSANQLAGDAVHLSPAPVISTATASSAAYVAYTSGSTGRPKGVVITHGATVAHARAFLTLFQLGVGDRVPLMAPAAFDLATEEMIPPLLAGATLIASTPTHEDMDAFTREIVRAGYTVLNLAGSLWQAWTEHLQHTAAAVPPQVRLLIAGSEALHTSTLRAWWALPGARAVRWVAAYGVCEATISSSYYLRAATDHLEDERLVPIGEPITGTRFYIVDSGGEPVPDGAEGELLIGGLGLARGYLDPELTDRKFAADPFSSHPGARIYRTGDLARRRRDGVVVWVGRRDGQLKVRGLRIEPGEIEAVLTEHPDISAAVVGLRPAPIGKGDREQLVAYVVPRTDRTLDLDDVGRHVAARVPALMVPARFEVVAQLPRNPNGKADRAALLASGRRPPRQRDQQQ